MALLKPRALNPQDRRARDAELVRAASSGSEQARRDLADRVLDRIRTSVRYLCGHHPDEADLVQLCLVEVLRSVHRFRGDSRLETWVDRIAVRTSLRHLKARRAEEARQRPEEEARPATDDDPEAALGRAQVRSSLARLLQKLTPERRGALVLQIVYGYSVQEIAELTDAPVETVRDRLKVGKKQLRRWVLADDALRDWAGGRTP